MSETAIDLNPHLDPHLASSPARAPHVIAIASGKGGVGKTNLTANLAVALAGRGLRVCVLDADLGLANLDTLLGVKPRATLRHVLRGECTIHDVLVEGLEIPLVPDLFQQATRGGLVLFGGHAPPLHGD